MISVDGCLGKGDWRGTCVTLIEGGYQDEEVGIYIERHLCDKNRWILQES